MDAIEVLYEWKKGGRGETMMSTFEYKSSHDKMFIEGFRCIMIATRQRS